MSFVSRLLDLIVRRGGAPDSGSRGAQIRLLIALAQADGALNAAEREALLKAATSSLGDAASATALLAQTAGEDLDELGAELRRSTDLGERRNLLQQAVALARADGSLGEIEAATLERFGRLLGVAVVEDGSRGVETAR